MDRKQAIQTLEELAEIPTPKKGLLTRLFGG